LPAGVGVSDYDVLSKRADTLSLHKALEGAMEKLEAVGATC
jgi:hypothetical protein